MTIAGSPSPPDLELLQTTTSAVVAGRQEYALLLRSLRAIPLQQVLRQLYFFVGLCGPQLTHSLGVPNGTTRSRIRRARLALGPRRDATASLEARTLFLVRAILLVSSLVSLLLLTACEHEAVVSQNARSVSPASSTGPTPVLVELYTSQGCLSCPPADDLLRELVHRHPSGATIVPLVFHVDYWNRLGWSDPFSDSRWTKRQSSHAAATGTSMLYTPQMLFNGKDHHVGTGRAKARAAVRIASAEPPALELHLTTARKSQFLWVSVDPQWHTRGNYGSVAIMVAITDGGHRMKVQGGDNAGQILESDFVVRDMVRACVLSAEDSLPKCEATLSLDPASNPKTIAVVAFGQDDSGRILGAIMK